ncbi:MAG: ABC transporter substrate-binding protein, partial [Pseudomonadota bacterium]
ARRGRLSRREFLSLASTFGLGAAASYGVLGAAPPAQAEIAAPALRPGGGGVLRIAMSVPPIRDPRLYEWRQSAEIARPFCEPLVRYRADGLFEPWLLRSWEVSADASRYLLRLRSGARWSNGDAFGAADVLANLRRWCDRGTPGNSMADRLSALIDPNTGGLAERAVDMLDDLTIRLTLLRPDVTLIAALTDYPALVTHRSFDATGADLAAQPLGTGPFELVSHEPGVRAEVRRRERGAWWGGEAYLDGVVWRDFTDQPSVEEAAFAAGEIDLNYETPPGRRAALDGLGLRALAAESAETVVIRLNRRVEGFADPRLGQAFQRAVDPAAIIKAAAPGEATPAAHHHVWPGHPEFADTPAPSPDPAAARALLAEAGLTAVTAELVSVDDAERRRAADAVAEQLNGAGVAATRAVLPAERFWRGWKTHPFSITPWTMRPLAAQTLALAYRSDAVWNESGFADPVFDALLEVALEVADLPTRRLVMGRLQRRLQSSGAIIQPYWRAVRRHHHRRVAGLQPHPMLELHLETVFLAP